jgi:nitroreductase
MAESCELIPHDDRYHPDLPPEQAAQRFLDVMRRRRSVRMFSDRPVSRETIATLVRCAATAPSGANKQPWRFVCIADPEIKRRIRLAAEEEERAFYGRRASTRWLEDLAPLGTDPDKGFLEVAPWLIVVFRLTRGEEDEQVYYSSESVGIAAGLLLAAAQHAGLATLTHTPSPMGFLGEICGRPGNERPFLLIPVGYPADDCRIPRAATRRKPLEEIMILADGR